MTLAVDERSNPWNAVTRNKFTVIAYSLNDTPGSQGIAQLLKDLLLENATAADFIRFVV
jgi:hypothetical protein